MGASRNTGSRIGVVVLASCMGAGSAPASSAGALDIGDVADRLVPQIVAMGGAIVAAMSVAGILLVGLGFLKLKEAAETKGQQIGYGQGAWRLVVGSGLLAVPSLLGVLQSTFDVSGSTVAAFFGS